MLLFKTIYIFLYAFQTLELVHWRRGLSKLAIR